MRTYIIKGKTQKKGWITNYVATEKSYYLAIRNIEEKQLIKGNKYCLIGIKSLYLHSSSGLAV